MINSEDIKVTQKVRHIVDNNVLQGAELVIKERNTVLEIPVVRSFIEAIASEEIGDDELVVETNDYVLTKKSFLRLKPRTWFNDECINAYVALVNRREKSRNKEDCFAFNTFFFTMLENMRKNGCYNFQKLIRIVDKKGVKLRNLKTILVPINVKDYHWLLLSCHLPTNTFFVLDSMGSSKEQAAGYVDIVRQFLQDYFHSTKSEVPSSSRKSLN